MKPIHTLQINYFKFFFDTEPIDLSGRHLLIYGENGSGKSSIYWALYTLLEATFKSDSELDEYFTSGSESCLLNLNKPESANAFVELRLANSTSYRISHQDFTFRKNINAEATLRGSDFINYRFMLKISDHRHRENIDLFKLFEKEVFPYIKTTRTFDLLHESRSTNDFNEIWRDLQLGPRSTSRTTASSVSSSDIGKGAESQAFSVTSSTTTTTVTRTEEVNRLQKEFASNLRLFVSEIKALTLDININGNEILSRDLGYGNIRFEIDCVQRFQPMSGGGELAGRESDIPIGDHPTILLQIPEYEGHSIPKPQSFLNEAKLTAIGIAIRFAILARRADYSRDADFQLIVMDDLLISLDMSNRRKVLDMLLSSYADRYQLIILTHDRSFFEKTKRQIFSIGKSEEWLKLEMYEDTRSIPTRPFIKVSETFLENATKHFLQFEFPAASNSLRKACEQLIQDLLPPHYVLSEEGLPIWQLDNLLAKAEAYYRSLPFDIQPVQELREHLKILLNPLSHSDLESQIYRGELIDVFKWYNRLAGYRNIKKVDLLAVGSILHFSLIEGASLLGFRIDLLEILSSYNLPSEEPVLAFCKFKCIWSQDGEDQRKPIEGSSLQEFYRSCCKKVGSEPGNIWTILSDANGRNLRDIFDQNSR